MSDNTSKDNAVSEVVEETVVVKESPEGEPAKNAEEGNAKGKKKPMPKKKKTTIGVVIGIVVLVIVGFWIWHETPGFCNFVCHSPMDYYVETFDKKDPHNGITQHANNNVTCLKCHEAKLTTQVSEVMMWISDNYPMTSDGKMLATGKEFASEEFCARSGCHKNANNMAEITAKTWGFAGNDEKYNPHSSHQDLALQCYDCHGIHEKNVLVCNECHDLKMPEGWEAPNAG